MVVSFCIGLLYRFVSVSLGHGVMLSRYDGTVASGGCQPQRGHTMEMRKACCKNA